MNFNDNNGLILRIGYGYYCFDGECDDELELRLEILLSDFWLVCLRFNNHDIKKILNQFCKDDSARFVHKLKHRKVELKFDGVSSVPVAMKSLGAVEWIPVNKS